MFATPDITKNINKCLELRFNKPDLLIIESSLTTDLNGSQSKIPYYA